MCSTFITLWIKYRAPWGRNAWTLHWFLDCFQKGLARISCCRLSLSSATFITHKNSYLLNIKRSSCASWLWLLHIEISCLSKVNLTPFASILIKGECNWVCNLFWLRVYLVISYKDYGNMQVISHYEFEIRIVPFYQPTQTHTHMHTHNVCVLCIGTYRSLQKGSAYRPNY